MPDTDNLRSLLSRIDGRSYPAYRDLKGRWELGECLIIIDHVQGDPFASPSNLRVRTQTGLPSTFWSDSDARCATEDWLLRRFSKTLNGKNRGSGKSGSLSVYKPGPEIIERSAVRLLEGGDVEVRFCAGLPARGRRILGHQAFELLNEDIITSAMVLHRTAITPEVHQHLQDHVRSVADQRALRTQLGQKKLVGFIANGAILPRASGIHQSPLPNAIPFQSPSERECTLDTPSGPILGMGIPEGVSLIVGGGFHGKSTLLQALQRGHLDHIPGDGREKVVALDNCVKIRAEDGRCVHKVNISPFLRNLPGGRETAPFSTDDASGSTSQAAAIIEAVESGSHCLLIDEDTSATNLLVRDERMRQLIPRESEPITPFVERVREIYECWGVSTVMVVGGVGDYLAVADAVIAMDAYVPRDVTVAANALGITISAPEHPLGTVIPRVPERAGLDPKKIRAHDAHRVRYGNGELQLQGVEQILDADHARSIAYALALFYEQLVDGTKDIEQVLNSLETLFSAEGVEVLSPRDYPDGRLIQPRRQEIAAAISRLRALKIR